MNKGLMRKLNIRIKRFLCVMLALAMVTDARFASVALAVPSTATSAALSDTMAVALIKVVRENLRDFSSVSDNDDYDAVTIDDVSDEDILKTFEDLRKSKDVPWDKISIVTTIEECAKLFDAEGEWRRKENGVDYLGSPMASGYSMGDLVVQYARSNISSAALISESVTAIINDEERQVDGIIEIYDKLADEKETPFIKFADLVELLDSMADSGNIKGYADMSFVQALNYEKYATFRDYTVGAGRVVPAGYLFVGTWLMDAMTINDTMYRMAVDSMVNDDQQIKYYKSELAGGRWRDISSATGLEYILPAGENVSESDLMGYYISVVVGADGIPRNPKTGEEIDIFNMVDPYDLYNMPEMRSLRMVYESGVVREYSPSPSDRFVYWEIRNMYAFNKPFERSDIMERDVRYILDVASRPGTSSDSRGIAFMAPRKSHYHENSPSADGRFEESGKGFILSLIQGAENGYMQDTTFTWTTSEELPENRYHERQDDMRAGGTRHYSFLGKSRLIRGNVSWKGEKAWVAEMNAAAPDGNGEAEINRRIHHFEEFWLHHCSLHDEVTDLADTRLASLKGLYNSFSVAGERENADMAMLTQERIDAERRTRTFYNLSLNENHNYVIGPVLNWLLDACSSGTTHLGEDFSPIFGGDGNFAQNSTVVSAIQEAITNSDASYAKYYGRRLAENETVVSKKQYELTEAVISKAASGIGAVRAEIEELTDIENIVNSVVAHKTRELETLGTLLGLGDERFSQKVHEGVNEDYTTSASDPLTTPEALKRILQSQKAEATAAAVELQLFIRGRVMRMKKDGAISFIEDRIDWADSQKAGVSGDEYGPYATEAIQEHIDYLKDLLQKVKGGSGLDDDNDLNKQQVELENDRLDALDDGDDNAIDDIDDKLEGVDDQLQKNRNRNRALLDSDASASAKAEAELELDGPEGVENDIANKLLDDIKNEDYDRVGSGLDALKGLGSKRIPDIVDALKASGAPANLVNDAEDAADDAKNGLLNDGSFGNGDGDGNGDGSGVGDGAEGDGRGNGDNNGPGGDDNEGNNNGGDGSWGEGRNGNGDDNDGDGGDNGDRNGNGRDSNGGRGGSGNGRDGNGTDGSGASDGGDGNGTGSGDNRGDISGNGIDDDGYGRNGSGGTPKGGGGKGKGSGLNAMDFDRAVIKTTGHPYDDLDPSGKAAMLAGLNRFADNRDDELLGEEARRRLDQLLADGNGFVYRQYLADKSVEYVSLAAADKCRRYSKFRWVSEDGKETMSQVAGGSASYVFEIGSRYVEKNNGDRGEMDKDLKKQSDPSIALSRTEEYPYLSEIYAGRFLCNTCEYITDTEWAILITPVMNKQVVALLEVMDEMADK